MIDLIKAATLVNNKDLQKQAQAEIILRRQNETEVFFVQNAQILQSTDLSPNIRQAAGTLLTVSMKAKTNNQFFWDILSPTAKSSLKDMVLGTMIDKEKVIRRAAANIVAAICCIEIPRKEWSGIAEKITSNINNEDLVIKEVSILTIGFICEQLKEFNFLFEESLQQTILTGILLGVKDSHPEIAETAFKALRDGIPSVSSILKNSDYRDYLITQIAEAIKSQKFIQLGLQCLEEFVKYNFAYMSENYVEGFALLIDPILRNTKEQSTCILAMDFWATFAKAEKNIEQNPQMYKFIKGSLADVLVEGLLQNLCFVLQQQQEENCISDSAGSALEAVFEGDSTHFQAKVLSFTEQTIKHENWKYRQASIRAFSLLLIGLPENISQSLVNSSLLQLIGLLNDQKHYVQYSAIKSLALISEQTGTVILHHQNFMDILMFIVKKTHVNQNFMKYVCKIIDNLCMVKESITVFKNLYDDLIKHFLDACLEPSRAHGSVNHCLCTILNLIKYSQSVVIANKYIEYVLVHFGKISSLEQQKRQSFYSGFFTLAQVCLMTIRKAQGSITMDQLSSLYNLVVNYYKQLNDVEGDGYYVVSALAFFIPTDKRLVDDFWKFIEYGLKKVNQEDIFRSTISCICDFASIYRVMISDKVNDVFNELLEIYEGNRITRQLKLDVLMCIGEMFLQTGEFCQGFLKRVMDLLLISCEGIIHCNDMNYVEVLQETIVETLMCIFHGLNNANSNQELVKYINFVFQFLSTTTQKNRHPKLDYIKQTMILMTDIVSFYPNETRNMLAPQFITDRLSLLVRYNNDGHLTQSIKYIRQQFRL